MEQSVDETTAAVVVVAADTTIMYYKNEIYKNTIKQLDEFELRIKFYHVDNTPRKYIPLQLKTMIDLKDQVNAVIRNYMKINLKKIEILNDEILSIANDSPIPDYDVSFILDKIKALYNEIDLGYSDIFSRCENILEDIQIFTNELNEQFINCINSDDDNNNNTDESDEDYIHPTILNKRNFKLNLINKKIIK